MKRLAWSMLAGVVAFAWGRTAQADEDGWSLEVTPYAWLTGIDADITVGDRKGEIDVGFDDLLDYVDFAGGLLLIADNNEWVIWAQGDYFSLDSDNETTKFDEAGTLEMEMTILEAAFGRKLNNPLSDSGKIDVLVGVRYTDIQNTFDPKAAGADRESDSELIDPMLVLRPWFPLTEKLSFNPTLAIGGGGDSELIYELQPQLQYDFTDSVALRVGYRRLYYKIEGEHDSEFDGSLHGMIVGLGVKL